MFRQRDILSVMNKLIVSWQRFVLICGLTAGIVSCATLPISELPSHNFGHRVKFLVMHFTAIDYQKSVNALVDEGGLSAHYLIPESNDPSATETNRLAKAYKLSTARIVYVSFQIMIPSKSSY